MRRILYITVILILLYVVKEFFKYTLIADLLNLSFIAGLIYLIYQIILYAFKPGSSVKVPIAKKSTTSGNYWTDGVAQNTKSNPTLKGNKDNRNRWLYGSIAIGVCIFLLRDFLGEVSFQFFLFIDKLVKFSPAIHPVAMWLFLGLFIGSIYGSFVAWKKYKLAFKVNLIPIGIFLCVVLVLFMINKPFATQTITDPFSTTEVKTDTTNSVVLKNFIINRWRTVGIVGKNRDNFIQRRKDKIIPEMEFTKEGKCYIYQNKTRKAALLYTIAQDGKSIFVSNPDNVKESLLIEIISIKENELVITSPIYQNDTALLKAQ